MTYIQTKDQRERLHDSANTEDISEGISDAEADDTVTAEKEDDTVVGGTQDNFVSCTAEKEVQDYSDANVETLYISGNVHIAERSNQVGSDGTAEMLVIPEQEGTPDVGHTAENGEELLDYYFDFLNNISVPDRSSAYDDSRNINMTFVFTSDTEDNQVSKMSESKDTESEPVNVIKRKA